MRRRTSLPVLLAFLPALWSSSFGCTDHASATKGALARVGDEAIHASVVQMIAARDGLDEDAARAQVADTLRWVAAAREDEHEGTPEPSPARRAQLVRAARARLWLETDFEPRHGLDALPSDHPLVEKAKTDPRYVRPRVHRVCQLIAAPHAPEGERETLARDAAWLERARAAFEPAQARMQRYVGRSNANACDLMQRLVRYERRVRGDVELRVESHGFVLDACAERHDDGTCKTPRWAPEWVERVERATGPGFLPSFETRFGLHLVYVLDILEPREVDDPEVMAQLREGVLPTWQRQAFAKYIEALEHKRTVRRIQAGHQAGHQR